MNVLKALKKSIKREKWFGILNILGLAIGMIMSLLIIWYIQYHLSSDSHHPNADQIYRLISKDKNNGSLSFGSPLPMAHTIQSDYPGVGEVAALGHPQSYTVTAGQSTYQVKASASSVNIFSVLGFNLLIGTSETVLEEPQSAVITQSCARKLFDRINPVGQTVIIDTYGGKMPFTIKGLIADSPANSNYSPEMLLAWQSINPPDWIEKWWWFGTHVFVKIKNDKQRIDLEQKINTILERHNAKFINGRYDFQLIPLKKSHFRTDIENPYSPGVSASLLWVLGIVALGIIIIACINFINLAIGQANKKAKETGICKVLGASRKSIATEFLIVTLQKTTISLIIAVLFIKLFATPFQVLVNMKESNPFSDPVIWVALVGMMLIAGILSGLYPALTLSRPKPVNLLSNNIEYSSSGSVFKKLLNIVQFVLANILIIAMLFIFKQISFMKEHELGFNKEGIIGVNISSLNNDLRRLGQMTTVMEQEIAKQAPQHGIVSQAATEAIPGNGYKNAFTVFELDKLESFTAVSVGIDENYAGVFGIPLTEGRNFSTDFASDEESILINETLKRKLGWNSVENKQLAIFDKNYKVPVIGVLKDIHINSLNQSIPPMIYRYKKNSYPQYMVFRVQSDRESDALTLIKNEWGKLSEGKPFDSFIVADRFKAMYGNEERLSKIIGAFCLIAIILSCFGLLAQIAATTLRRTKEIGIRKVNGAKVSEILTMLNKDFLKWAAISFVIACPIAWYAMSRWLENFAYKTTLSWWIFALAGVLALGIALITVSWQSWRAATRNPVETLRYE